jgi:DNA polymerase-3 subunit alpha
MKLAGMIVSVEKKFTRKDGKPFAVIILEDFTGPIEMTAWEDSYTKHAEILIAGNVVGASVRVSKRDESIRVNSNSFELLKPRATKRPVDLLLDHSRLNEAVDLAKISEAISRYPGQRAVRLGFRMPAGSDVWIRASDDFKVGDERALRGDLIDLLVI